MKKLHVFAMMSIAALLGLTAPAIGQQDVAAYAAPIDAGAQLPRHAQQDKRRFARNYRQQPPLIPHQIEQYQIDRAVNQCLGCHDWSKAGEKNAPTLSMTHYMDRDGRQTDAVSARRWFCNQCHVPQADVPPLVDNEFTPSSAR